MKLNLNKNLVVIFSLIIWVACSEDDQQNAMVPRLEITSDNSIKPDSTMSIEVTAEAPGLLIADGIDGAIINGDGVLSRTDFQGENQSTGKATFEFTAGSLENSTALIRFSAIDQAGQTGTMELEVEITSLDFKQVLVLNEGNFLSANGNIDAFDITQDQVNNTVYQANATIQDASLLGDKIYLVTNAPDGLQVLNEQLELESSINQGFDNPIDFAAIGNTGYVSNWGDINTAFTGEPDSYIAIVDLENNMITDSLLLTERPQNILAYEDMLYIANEGGSTVSVLDPEDLTRTDITVSSGPSQIVVDGNGHLWVLCTSGALVEIDPGNLSVGTTIDGLTTAGFGEKMAVDGTGNFIYYLGGSNSTFTGLTTVYKVDLSTMQVIPFIENGFALYGIGVNPESNEVYIGDSNAFQSTGTGFRYNSDGSKLNEFPTGIGPRDFLFR